MKARPGCVTILVPALLATVATAHEIVPGQAVVRLEPLADVATAVQQLDAVSGGEVIFTVQDSGLAGRMIYLLAYNGPESAPAQEVGEILATWVDTYPQTAKWAELVVAGQDPEGSTGSVWFHSLSGQMLYPGQYSATHVGAATAHGRTTGAGMVVAVLDTGLDAGHPLFTGRIAPGGWNFVNGTANTDDAGDGLDNDEDGAVDESVGHGTFVAGLIHLVAPSAKLLPIRVLNDEGQGTGWLFGKGVFYAIDRGVEVINLSLGSTAFSNLLQDGVDEAKTHGIVVVAAGGNQGAGPPDGQYPALLDAAFGVAAVDNLDVKAPFSNFNEAFFISAPGRSVQFASGGFDPDRSVYSALPGGDYGVWEGTSFATALVSGAVALVRAQHPEWAPHQSTHAQIRSTLAQTADSIDDLNVEFQGQLGAGRLNAGAAAWQGPVSPVLGDVDADGVVGEIDLGIMLEDWGVVHSSADLNGDGVVRLGDVLILLSNWNAAAEAPEV